METQTLVTMGRSLARDRFTFRSVLVHEYAHQWYGDAVTPDSWPDLWLNESFAMYTELAWQVSRGWTTWADVEAFLVEADGDLRASDGPPGAYDPDRFAENSVYLCGALMLDRLANRLGPELFAQVLREWPQTHRGANVDRADYIAWLNQRTGQDLGPFITEWLTSPTTPAI
jgi:aminopeptidase N